MKQFFSRVYLVSLVLGGILLTGDAKAGVCDDDGIYSGLSCYDTLAAASDSIQLSLGIHDFSTDNVRADVSSSIQLGSGDASPLEAMALDGQSTTIVSSNTALTISAENTNTLHSGSGLFGGVDTPDGSTLTSGTQASGTDEHFPWSFSTIGLNTYFTPDAEATFGLGDIYLSLTPGNSGWPKPISLCPLYPFHDSEEAAQELVRERNQLVVAIFRFTLHSEVIKDPVKRAEIAALANKIYAMLQDGPVDFNATLSETYKLISLLAALRPTDFARPYSTWTKDDFIYVMEKLQTSAEQMVTSFERISCLLQVVSKDRQTEIALDRLALALLGRIEILEKWATAESEAYVARQAKVESKNLQDTTYGVIRIRQNSALDNVLTLLGAVRKILNARPIDYKALFDALRQLDEALAKLEAQFAPGGDLFDPTIAEDSIFNPRKYVADYRAKISTLFQKLQQQKWKLDGVRVD